jgi:hypothetical protein
MQIKGIVAVVAAGLSLVAAQDETTTSTSTLTQTITITKCNPTVTNCPARNTSTSTSSTTWSFPLSNSTSTAGPTGPTAVYNSTSYSLPASTPLVTETAVVTTTPTKSGSTGAASTVSVSGARGLMVQSGLLLGVLGAGVAFLA